MYDKQQAHTSLFKYFVPILSLCTTAAAPQRQRLFSNKQNNMQNRTLSQNLTRLITNFSNVLNITTMCFHKLNNRIKSVFYSKDFKFPFEQLWIFFFSQIISSLQSRVLPLSAVTRRNPHVSVLKVFRGAASGRGTRREDGQTDTVSQ